MEQALELSRSAAESEFQPATAGEVERGALPRAELPGGSDAPPSNRASESCNRDEFLVVWQGVDSLELSIPGEMYYLDSVTLKLLKEQAQDHDPRAQAQAVVVLDGRYFMVHDKGAKPFAFVLEDDRFFIKVRDYESGSLPLAHVQIRSAYLVHRGVEAAVQEAVEAVAGVGKAKGEPTVSRFDLALDFVSRENMEGWSRSAWVTRAQHKQSHSIGERFSGWSIGLKGPTAARLYDKTLEIEMQSKKYYLHALWDQAGRFPGDPVWRLEFQIRRPTLAQFGLTSLEQVLNARDSLWQYLTGEWLRLTVPNPGDDTRARWPTHSLWERLAAVRWEGSREPLTREYRGSKVPSDKWIAQAGTAVATSIMAKYGYAELDTALKEMHDIILGHWADRELLEGAPAERLLLDRALLKERKYGTHRLADGIGADVGKLHGSAGEREPGSDDL